MLFFIIKTFLCFVFLLLLYLIIKYCVKRIRKKNFKLFVRSLERNVRNDVKSDDDLEELLKISYLHHGERVNGKKYDCIVIGSGMSGMTTQGLLSQCGKKVLLLEQHEKLGGMTNTWEEDGYEFPSGLHFLTNTCRQRSFRVILDQLTENQLDFKDYPDPFNTIFVGDKEYKVHVNQRKYLCEEFPEEEERINMFFDLVEQLQFKELDILMILRPLPVLIRKLCIFVLEKFFDFKMFKCNKMSNEQILDEFGFKNTSLRKLISYYHILAGDYSRLTALYNLSLCASLCVNSRCCIDKQKILGGKSQIVGGCQMISKYVFDNIKKNGGEFYAQARVENIILRNGNQAIGVQMTNGDRIYSDHVVSTVGLINTYRLLGSKKQQQQIPQKVRRLKKNIGKKISSSVQHFCVFVAYDGSYEDLEIPPNDIIVINDDFKNEYLNGNKVGVEPHMIFVGNVNHITPVFKDEKPKTLLTLIVITTWEQFEEWKDTKVKQRGNDYGTLKHEIIEEVIKSFHKRYPKLDDTEMEVCVGGSPLSTNHWTCQPRGESYGMVHDEDRLFVVYDTYIKPLMKEMKNLHFTGMDSYVCAGVSSAAYSGLMTANEIIGENLIWDDFNKAKKMIKEKLIERNRKK